MDSNDAAELIAELKEDRAEHASEEQFSRRAALLIAVMAAVLAVGGLGGGNATDDMVLNTIRASDTWAFYQAKNVRQTMYELQVDELQARPAPDAGRVAEYQAKIARYDDEPDPEAPDDPLRGEGKKQLMAQAKVFEAARDTAIQQDNSFDYAEVVLQLALVLGSVAILASNRTILTVSGVLGALGAVLTLNGFLLLFPLPF